MRTMFAFVALLSLLMVDTARAVEPVPSASPSPAATATPAPTPPKLHVYSCQVISGPPLALQANEVGLIVRFQNESTDTFRELTWRAKYGNGYVDFANDGTFSPNVRIDNFLLFDLGKAHANVVPTVLNFLFAPAGTPGPPLLTDVHFAPYVSLTDPENCSIVQTIRADDDQTWIDPTAPAAHFSLPTPTPSPNPNATPTSTPQPVGPVQISDCQVQFPGRDNVQVGFYNLASKTADKVTWRASYGRGTIDVDDQGTFEPAVEIRHWLHAQLPDELRGRQYIGLHDLTACKVVSVHYTDGTSWSDTTLGATPPPPTPVPDALEYSTLNAYQLRWKATLALPTESPAPASSPSSTPTP